MLSPKAGPYISCDLVSVTATRLPEGCQPGPGQALCRSGTQTMWTLSYLLVQNAKEPLSQARVCFLSGHGHLDSVLYRKWIASRQS